MWDQIRVPACSLSRCPWPLSVLLISLVIIFQRQNHVFWLCAPVTGVSMEIIRGLHVVFGIGFSSSPLLYFSAAS